MLSNKDTKYLQVLDPYSPTSVTTYVWPYKIFNQTLREYEFYDPIKWDYFMYQPLKIIVEHKHDNKVKLLVLTSENQLFFNDNESIENGFVNVDYNKEILDIKYNYDYLIILTFDGSVYCNRWERVENICTNVPVNFGINVTISKIACGKYHSVVLDTNCRVYAWGENNCGQLGLGDKEPRTLPQQVNYLTDKYITQIDCDDYYSVFVESNTNIYACGHNYYIAELSSKFNEDAQLNPQKIKFRKSVVIRKIHCWNHGIIILTSDHKLYFWISGRINTHTMPTKLIINEKIKYPVVDIYANLYRFVIVYKDYDICEVDKNQVRILLMGNRPKISISIGNNVRFFNNNRLAVINSGRFTKSARF